jgi:hypothetical protein
MHDLNAQVEIQLFRFIKWKNYQKEMAYMFEKIKSKGIKFDQEPTDQSWLWREARLKDVDGNQLILFYGGENRLNPPWRINN